MSTNIKKRKGKIALKIDIEGTCPTSQKVQLWKLRTLSRHMCDFLHQQHI